MRRLVFLMLATVAAFSAAVLLAIGIFLFTYHKNVFHYFGRAPEKHLFSVQSIDTMKYSRDMAAQMLAHPDSFKSTIDAQMALIAEAGATHVAIDTPYDAQFLPVLRLWVASARAHGLSVWFRGNFSGWEGWFGYPKIDRVTHERLLEEFLLNNPDLFRSGDVFTPCPECENGGPGDPRQTGDVGGYNTFLIQEKEMSSEVFALQLKDVAVYPSMNADIARQIITPATVSAFGGTILIDQYVQTPEQFATALQTIPQELGARVGLGEFGAPIPDLNGEMTEVEQASYIDSLLKALYAEKGNIPVINYWDLVGGSTALVNADGTPRAAYFTVQNYFKAFNVYGVVYNSLGEAIKGARIQIDDTPYSTTSDETYQIFVPRQYSKVTIQADGYKPTTLTLPSDATTTVIRQDVYLEPSHPDWWYEMRAYLYEKLQLKVE
ncbi:MAG: peptidase associated/transthyretin-like domain-containing protein [Minisyncoccota bacterium]